MICLISDTMTGDCRRLEWVECGRLHITTIDYATGILKDVVRK